MENPHLRAMGTADIASVVLIHRQAFSGFFLTGLGEPFLRELYAGILADPSGICFGYQTGGELKGFVAGTDAPVGLYARLLRRRWWRFALASIRPCLSQPWILPRLLRGLKTPRRARPLDGHGLIMSLAVLPAQQGKGVGRALIGGFLDEATRRGLTTIKLTTDAVHNEAANRFYCRAGFELTQVIATPEGRRLNEYAIDLRGAPAGPRAGLAPAAVSS
jgi:ribosomal protein S18 acetylase RimI-like enzyme